MNRSPFSARFVCAALVIGAIAAARTAARAEPPKPPKPPKPPNILLAISDDQSWAHTGAAGYPGVRTPAFDRIAREGVLFTQAFCASPGCSPSRAALLTGRPTWQLREAGTHASSFPKDLQVYPDLLERAGYHVGHTGKGWGPGNWRAGGRERNPAGPEYNHLKTEAPARAVSANDYAGNFEEFLKARPAGAPFCFWYGGAEPHLPYEKGGGVRSGKRLEEALVPPFLPDHPVVRGDMLDYCREIEWFDGHLGRMLAALEARGELENTLVVVTSDNGMPLPRAKANLYEYGIRMPLAVRWPARVPGGRRVEDLVSLTDLAPTFLQAAGLTPLPVMTGRSLMDLLTSGKGGRIDASRDTVYSARERHSSSRPENLGYPARALRTQQHLYIRNLAPDRWPAGDPRVAEPKDADDGFWDIDASPTKSLLLAGRESPELGRFFRLAVEKRPAEELYDIRKDPGCVENLAADAAHRETRSRLRKRLDGYLRRTEDPRMGKEGEVWEGYPRYSPIRRFPAATSAP